MWSTVSSLVDTTAGKMSRFSDYRNRGFDSSPSSFFHFRKENKLEGLVSFRKGSDKEGRVMNEDSNLQL